KQYKKGTKARQLEFFARRRMRTSRIVAAGEHDPIGGRVGAGQIGGSELPEQGVKRIRGSFDVFALVGKEEFIGVKSWSDVVQGSSDRAEPRATGLSYSNISIAPATYGSQPADLGGVSDTYSASNQDITSSGPAQSEQGYFATS
ncbi:hypothetical protein GGI17_006728, partial [Coemansia sp. S146]